MAWFISYSPIQNITVTHHCNDITSRRDTMSLQCPKCSSERIATRNKGQKAGAIIGATAGAASGVSGALAGAEIGALTGAMAGPIGIPIGGLGGAIFGALTGGTAGCLAGAKVGELLDQRVLDNYVCLGCDHTFNNRPL
jgi:hypothetical protein